MEIKAKQFLFWPFWPYFVYRNGGYLCKVCLAVDNTFLKHYMAVHQPHETTVRHLGKIIDNASWIYRSTDFNGDGVPDNVGLDYDPQFDTFTYIDNGNESLTVEELDEIYGDLARLDFSDCCIAVAYTMKRFHGPVLAKASVQAGKIKKTKKKSKIKPIFFYWLIMFLL